MRVRDVGEPHGRPESARTCIEGAWSEPRVVATLPPHTFLRSPTLAFSAGQIFVSGTPTPAGVASEGGARVGFAPLIHQGTGDPIGLPAGVFHFLNARLLRGRGGRLHLVWGETDSLARSIADAVPVPRATVSALWFATFTPGEGWSPAEQITAASEPRGGLYWNTESADASSAKSGRIDLIIPRRNAGLLHLTFDEGRWRGDELPVTALYATITHGVNDTLYLATLGEDPTVRGRRDLMVMSSDGRTGWSSPSTLRDRDTRGAIRPRLLSGPNGVLHLIFGTATPGSLGTGWVRHLSSSDGGRHWSAPHDLELPHEQFTKWRAGLSRCGTPQLVVSTWITGPDGPAGTVLHSSLRDSVWTALEPLIADRGAREVQLQSDPNGYLHLIASVRRRAGDPLPASYEVALSRFVEPATSASR